MKGDKMPDQDLVLLNNSNVALEYFRLHLHKIIEDFNNKFIAIKERNIIDSGETMDILLHKLTKKGEDTSVVVIKFVSKDKFIL